MEIKKTIATFMVLTVFALPAVTFASTYQFVDQQNKLQSVEASSFAGALASASNIATHSGVMLGTFKGFDGTSRPSSVTNTGNTFYQYIDSQGRIRSVNASSATNALSTASNIGMHSGVILVTNNSMVTK